MEIEIRDVVAVLFHRFEKHANTRRCNGIPTECEFLQRRAPRYKPLR
jgi:hypothetical protein